MKVQVTNFEVTNWKLFFCPTYPSLVDDYTEIHMKQLLYIQGRLHSPCNDVQLPILEMNINAGGMYLSGFQAPPR